jgi:hypothetical protein
MVRKPKKPRLTWLRVWRPSLSWAKVHASLLQETFGKEKVAVIVPTRSTSQSDVYTGLVNATVGTVEDIIWQPGAESSNLPIAVLVSWRDVRLYGELNQEKASPKVYQLSQSAL